jgi:hypothetical protein
MGSSGDNGHAGRPRVAFSAASLLGASAALCGISSALILTRHRLPAGLAALLATASLIAGTSRARAGGRRDLVFAESIVDRVFDASILAPLAWVWRSHSARVALLALVGLAISYVASYERARGRSLGYRGTETVEYRAVRAAILVLGLLTGWIEATLWAYVAIASAAAVVRVWNVAQQERRSSRKFGVSS